jgi:hypothetical protein
MSEKNSLYYDMMAVVNDYFCEMQAGVLAHLRKHNSEYNSLQREARQLVKDHEILRSAEIDEGEGELTLSAEEHKAYATLITLNHSIDHIERIQIYLSGHHDCIVYLKRIGMI